MVNSALSRLGYALLLLQLPTAHVAPEASAHGRRAKPPHLIVVVGDDFGTYDAGSYRGGRIPTPAVDALVANGLIMDSFYVFQICSPTRSSLITGRYPFHVSQALPEGFHAISRQYETLPSLLKRVAAYETYHVAKWHMGFYNTSYTPAGQGFDHSFSFLCACHDVDHWNQGGHFTTTAACTGQDIWTEQGPAIGRNGSYSAELYGAAAVDFVHQHASVNPGHPMFLQVEYFVPHAPTNPGPPARYIPPLFAALEDKTRANYSGMVVSMDEAIHNLTKALKSEKMWQTSLLVLFGDNGGAVPDGGRNWPLRGCKWTSWEGGVRQTAVWAGGALPAQSVGKRFSGLAHVADIYVTFATAANTSSSDLSAASAKGPVPFDGVSLWDVLQNPKLPSPRTEVLLYGQGWHPDPRWPVSLPASDALNCSSAKQPSGMAYHQPVSLEQHRAKTKSIAAADSCAASCCASRNCTGWMLTTPKYPRPPCLALQPCCWLVNGGELSASADPHAYSGASGREPTPPVPKAEAGALRMFNYKIIIGLNKHAGWYPAPEDVNETALNLARTFCKLAPDASFPPTDVPNCESPGCLFDLDLDPCEMHNLAAEMPAKLEELTARLHVLSAKPVPYDSCLPGCTASLACSVAKDRYSNFFGPYFPPISKTPLKRWPCKDIDTGKLQSKKVLLQHGLQIGLDRLRQQLAQPAAPDMSNAGDEANVLSICGAALAEMDLNGNVTAAEQLVRLVFARQKSDGRVPWLPTQPLTTWDAHGTVLCYLQLVPLLYRHGHLFSPAFLDFLRPKLKLGLKFSFSASSSGLWYTNILVARITNNILMGRWLNEPTAVAEGEALLDQWLNFTHNNANVFIHEYASTFYFWNDLNALLPAAQYYHTSESRPTNRLRAVADQVFAHMSASYFPPTATMTGPHSRDYNFLDGKFYIIRGVWGAGIMGFTTVFLDSDDSAVTAAHLSDLQNAVLYHTITTEDGYRPPCDLVALGRSQEGREVRSLQGLASNVTADRTVFIQPDLGISVGSVSEDFEAVNCPKEDCPAWNAQSKELNIEMAPPKGWDIASKIWPSITIVVDDHDAPWGLVRLIPNWSKPTHLRGRLGSVQHTHINTTVLFATLDIDAAQPVPDGGRESRPGLHYLVERNSTPPLLCNASQARHDVGFGGNFHILDKRMVPLHTALTVVLDQCATACCTLDKCTGWAVKPVGNGSVCELFENGELSVHKPGEISGKSGRSIIPPATNKPARSSLATNVLFPCRANLILLDGRPLLFPKADVSAPFVVPSATINENATLLVVQGGVCVAVRVIRADPVMGGGSVRIEVQADSDSLQRNAARLVIYHYHGTERILHGSVKAALAFVTGPCFGDPSSFVKLVNEMTATTTVDSTNIWNSTLHWAKGALSATAPAGWLTVTRQTNESGSTSRVLKRMHNGVELQLPGNELEVNGEKLSFLPGSQSIVPRPPRVTPTDPKALARLVGDAFFKEAKPPGVNAGMLKWQYGAALILDGMFQSVSQFGFDDWVPQMSKYMDAYTSEKGCRGYNLAHNITMPWDRAVGDLTGLFPISFLQRALYNKELDGKDMAIANLTADHYILQWPIRLADGTFSRLVGGHWPNETSTETGSFIWGDDQTMGTVLVARMAPLFKRADYAAEVTRQQIGFAGRLRDPKDGLDYHGYNENDRHVSCCKWGRANGWGMLGHAEALSSMNAWPEGYPDKTKNDQVRQIFQQHASAFKATQSSDGRWHQLLNDTNSFLETSVTAMAITSLIRGVRGGLLPKAEYAPVIELAWKGLVSTVMPNGTVTQVCCGTDIEATAQDYYNRPTSYTCSGPGGAGAVLYAAVDLAKGY